MKLRTKFNLAMGGSFVVALLLAGLMTHRLTRETAMRQVLQEVSILHAQAEVWSAYTASETAPLLSSFSTTQFLPQSVPFWAVRTSSEALQRHFPEYSVCTPALNPTNTANRPNVWQTGIIERFRADGKLAEQVSERESPAGPVLSVSRPIRIDASACLQCHSTPEAAPAAMVELYGNGNGFGWTMGETVGAQIVSVPMQVPLSRAWEAFRAIMIGLAAMFALLMLAMNLLLHLVVIRPLNRVCHAANEISLGNLEQPELPVAGHDEMALLATAFNRMHRSFAKTMRMLAP